jgi:S1-C subfamily serine protease
MRAEHFAHSWLAGPESSDGSFRADRPDDGRNQHDEPLDAYSRAVTSVVDRAGPAVIALRGRRGSPPAGSGSGFLIAADGFAVTNSHVLAGRAALTATTADGDSIDATAIGDDPATDIAVVRLAARDLPTVPLLGGRPAQAPESPAPRVGQLVIAMGSPFGLEATVSAGIVSALNRSMRGVGGRLIDGVIQHTAPINPGNSGGPLLDWQSRVVGVNTAAIALAQSVGFAVPASTVRWVVGEILTHGRVTRPTLGITATTAPIPGKLARTLDLLNESGIEVRAVAPNSPAAAADLREGDLIVAFGGRLVSSVDDLHRMLARLRPPNPIALTIIRTESRLEVTLSPSITS